MIGFLLAVIGGGMVYWAIKLGIVAHNVERELASQGRYADIAGYRRTNPWYGPLGFFGFLFLIVGLMMMF